MDSTSDPWPRDAVRTYAALRYSGASPSRAQNELALAPRRADQLEALFRLRRPGKGPDEARPKFARHETHVRAVLKAGGYPVLGR